MYAVVKFLDENDALGIVCSHWINEDNNTCLYPNVKTNEARDKLLRKLAEPEQSWCSCKIRILHKYSSFSVASIQLCRAEDTSNLDSEGETYVSHPRRRKKRSFFYPGEESDEEVSPSQKISKKHAAIPYPVPPKEPTFLSHPLSSPTPFSVPQQQVPANDSQLEKVVPTSSQTIINGKFIAWMACISEKVQQVNDKLCLVLENQAKLLTQHRQVSEKGENFEDLQMLGNLPVNDEESFIELNKKISGDGHLRQLLIKVLMSVGGKDMRCHINNMLRRLLCDEVAELYTLTGKSKVKFAFKKPFLTTHVLKSIFSACQRVYKDMATEAKVKEAVGDWLNQAKVRKARRLQRHEKNMDKNVELPEEVQRHEKNMDKNVELPEEDVEIF